jgi:periplasmic copper chaperone A
MRRSLLQTVLAVAAAALVLAGPAAGHGTLSPSTAAAGVLQRFELTVPNARLDADIVGISLALPEGAVLESAEAEQPRWAVTSDEGSVRWSGGPIDRGGAETFAFTVRLPPEPGSAEFTLVETFDDGDAAPFPIPVLVTGESGATSSA